MAEKPYWRRKVRNPRPGKNNRKKRRGIQLPKINKFWTEEKATEFVISQVIKQTGMSREDIITKHSKAIENYVKKELDNKK
ncbi:hypothetical protein KKG83_06105 [Candidatus Micrarchaeota archaeon]|nr:hypothetical protein [Candidatus Micrarchaeota archaeon]MBU2477016.1 hypothetical protein [Candidatus Micrarchaeota archaeon]